jgi:hypothetical protein
MFNKNLGDQPKVPAEDLWRPKKPSNAPDSLFLTLPEILRETHLVTCIKRLWLTSSFSLASERKSNKTAKGYGMDPMRWNNNKPAILATLSYSAQHSYRRPE